MCIHFYSLFILAIYWVYRYSIVYSCSSLSCLYSFVFYILHSIATLGQNLFFNWIFAVFTTISHLPEGSLQTICSSSFTFHSLHLPLHHPNWLPNRQRRAARLHQLGTSTGVFVSASVSRGGRFQGTEAVITQASCLGWTEAWEPDQQEPFSSGKWAEGLWSWNQSLH